MVSIGPLGPLHVISDGRSLITVQVRVTLVPALGVSEMVVIATECLNSKKEMQHYVLLNCIYDNTSVPRAVMRTCFSN